MENDKFDYRFEVMQSPIRFLGEHTRQLLSLKLDSKKVILTKTQFHRDWRGLAEKAGLELSAIRSCKISPTHYCICLWTERGGLLGDLIKALEEIDRFDVIDDYINTIYDDYDKASVRESTKICPSSFNNGDENSAATFDANVITTDDQKNLREGGTFQRYDALVLSVDADSLFVDEMVDKMEKEFKLKLCLMNRDFVGGLQFEVSAVVRLINEGRCARVIVVLSPDFLKSSVNQFFTRFAHALSIDKKERIVIPCMYKPCIKPPEIFYCHSLDYYRTKGYWDYWKKLAASITSEKGNSSCESLLRPLDVERSASSSSSNIFEKSNNEANSNGRVPFCSDAKEIKEENVLTGLTSIHSSEVSCIKSSTVSNCSSNDVSVDDDVSSVKCSLSNFGYDHLESSNDLLPTSREKKTPQHALFKAIFKTLRIKKKKNKIFS